MNDPTNAIPLLSPGKTYLPLDCLEEYAVVSNDAITLVPHILYFHIMLTVISSFSDYGAINRVESRRYKQMHRI